MTEHSLITLLVALYSMTNPIGNVGIFAGMTSSKSEAEVKHTAWLCAAAVVVTMLIVTWTGELLVGLSILRGDNSHSQTPDEAGDSASQDQIAIVPLAVPNVADPGAINAAEHHPGHWPKIELSVVVIAFAALIAYSRPIATKLGNQT